MVLGHRSSRTRTKAGSGVGEVLVVASSGRTCRIHGGRRTRSSGFTAEHLSVHGDLGVSIFRDRKRECVGEPESGNRHGGIGEHITTGNASGKIHDTATGTRAAAHHGEIGDVRREHDGRHTRTETCTTWTSGRHGTGGQHGSRPRAGERRPAGSSRRPAGNVLGRRELGAGKCRR